MASCDDGGRVTGLGVAYGLDATNCRTPPHFLQAGRARLAHLAEALDLESPGCRRAKLCRISRASRRQTGGLMARFLASHRPPITVRKAIWRGYSGAWSLLGGRSTVAKWSGTNDQSSPRALGPQ